MDTLDAPVLAIDVGASRTKAAVIARSDERHRLIWEGKVPASNATDRDGDIATALRRLQSETGWEPALRGSAAGSSGPVETVITSSRAKPIRVICITSGAETSEATVDRVLGLGFCDVVLTRWLSEDAKGARAVELQELLQGLDSVEADVVVVAAKSREDVGVIAGALCSAQIRSSKGRPVVLYAGSDDLAAAFQSQLEKALDLRHVSSSDWLSPSFDSAEARRVLDGVWMRAVQAELGSVESLVDIRVTKLDPSPRESSLAMSRYLAGTINARVGIVDIGGQTSGFLVASPPGLDATKDEEVPQGTIGLGTGMGLREVLERIPIDWIRAWLPFDISTTDLTNHLANRALRTNWVPGDLYQLMLHMAVARECGFAARRWYRHSQAEILIASGSIAEYPRVSQSALVLLDILQPVGPSRLLIDNASLLPRIGAIARFFPAAAASLLSSDTFLDAGPCLSVSGGAKEGDVVAEIEVDMPEGGGVELEGARQTHEVRFGTLSLIDIPLGLEATVRIEAVKKISLGLESGVTAWTGSSERPENGDLRVRGGVLGLIIDARGRPLELSSQTAVRQARLIDWSQGVRAFDPEVFSRLD